MVPKRLSEGEDSPADSTGGHSAPGHGDSNFLFCSQGADRGKADLRPEPGLQSGVSGCGRQAVKAPQYLHPVCGE